MTISNQLNYVKTIKTNIKQAIENKGVTIASDTAFSDYPDKIGEIGGILQAKTLTAGADTADTTIITPDSNYSGLSSVTVDLSYISNRLNALAGNGVAPVNYGPSREVSAQGVYQLPASSYTFTLPANATDLGSYALYNAFCHCTNLTSADLSSLITISGMDALQSAFQYCPNLISVDLSNLTTVSGSFAMNSAFTSCTSLTSVDLSSLTDISEGYTLSSAFYGCTGLTTLSFPALTSNSFGSYDNQFSNMLRRVTGCTVHFPSNLQSVIGSWSDVYSGFGGDGTTVLFDLPATT